MFLFIDKEKPHPKYYVLEGRAVLLIDRLLITLYSACQGESLLYIIFVVYCV
jgi:hypothetical protein